MAEKRPTNLECVSSGLIVPWKLMRELVREQSAKFFGFCIFLLAEAGTLEPPTK